MGLFIREVQDFLQTRCSYLCLLYLKNSLKNFLPSLLKKTNTLFQLWIAFGLISCLYFEACREKQAIKPNLIGVLTDEKHIRESRCK